MADTAAFQATVAGRVQGVFFRVFVTDHARELGLTGWVRNLPDGSVEVLAEGARPDLEKLVELLHQGPPASQVTDVRTRWTVYAGKYTEFAITR